MKTQKLTVLEKVGFGSGDTAVNVVISAFFLIINFFYTDIFGLDPKHLAALFLVANIVDGFTDPLMGMVTDRFETRWGRYRPYFLWFSVPFGITIVLAFSTPDFAYNGKLIWAYATHILLKVGFTIVTIPYISLVSVLTGDPQERLSANGYRLFLAKVGALLVTSLVPILAKFFGKENTALGYQVAMGLMAAVAVVLFLFCFATTTERIRHTGKPQPFLPQLKLLLRNDQWLVLAGVCLIGTIGYVIRASCALYYATYFLGADEKGQSIFMTTGVVATIIAMAVSTWVTKSFCKIKLFRYSQLAVPLCAVLLYFAVGPNQFLLGTILYALLCFVIDLHAPVFWSAIAEAVDYGEKKDGARAAGLSFGGISFFQKLGIGLAGVIVNIILDRTGYIADQPQTAKALGAIVLMVTLLPAAFHLVMGLLMFRYKITDDYYLKIVAGPSRRGANPE